MSAIEKLLEPLAEELSNEFVKSQINKMFGSLSDVDIEEIGVDKIQAKKDELTKTMGTGMTKSMVSSTKKLASKLVLLTEGAIDFAIRLATVPLAIIGMGTTGPTISINLILPLIKQLQGEARNLSSVYDDVKSSLEALQMENLSESNAVIGGIYTTIQAEMKIVKTMVLLVGVRCDGEEGDDISEYEESPMPVDATVCKEYLPDTEHANTEEYPKDAVWCIRFEHIMGKTINDFQDDEYGTAADKYEEWRKENAKVLEDFTGSETETAEEQYMAWLKENHVCKNCKNFKRD